MPEEKFFTAADDETIPERLIAVCRGNFFDGWMKNPYSAMISCNDGLRPVSFLLERCDTGC